MKVLCYILPLILVSPALVPTTTKIFKIKANCVQVLDVNSICETETESESRVPTDSRTETDEDLVDVLLFFNASNQYLVSPDFSKSLSVHFIQSMDIRLGSHFQPPEFNC